MAKRLRLSQNKFAVVDDETYEWAKAYRWCAAKWKNVFYAVRTMGRKTIPLHHCVVGRPLRGVVDHIDGDGLNNQVSNLRLVSVSVNLQNSFKHRQGHLTGTHIRARNGRWQAVDTIRKRSVGTFGSKEEAAAALIRRRP